MKFNILFFISLIGLTSEYGFGSYNYIFTSLTFIGPALYAGYDKMSCLYYGDCCPKERVKPNLRELKYKLDNQLFGQPIVKDVVIKGLGGHLMNDEPQKALVFSFHGWTGTGKNYVAKFIVESLYKSSMQSPFVHLFIGTIHFPHESQVDIYKMHLQDWIRGNVSRCEQSIFIFDEIDKMPLGVIGAIKPFIDYHDNIDGVDFRKTIFIFLSNTGGNLINQKVITLWREASDIDDITFRDLEALVQKGAFNEVGGLHHSDIISHNLVDYYIPFLPLQKKHVKKCIQRELERRRYKITNEFVNKVADSLNYFPPGTGLLSTTGCKVVPQRVSYYLSEEVIEQ